ncbi:MAG: crossover junction endodeoxyribonuclease RuvC [Bacteroidota bacterium]
MRRNSNRSAAEPDAPTGSGAPIVLGVDPGTLSTGFGVVARSGKAIRLLGCGTIRNHSSLSMPLRLKKIYDELQNVIDRFQPTECAIESAFYGKNAQSALKLGHARGVSIVAAVQKGVPTTEYSPREVKKAVVGRGNASKEQVQFMVKALLSIHEEVMLHDTSDALAIALCHFQRYASPAIKFKDWKSYAAAYPGRVKR